MNLLKTIKLQDFFDKTGYKWEKDKDTMQIICGLTKTRPRENVEEFHFTDGHEQTFFLKALAEYYGSENFFEIGTGRGTACYALSLLDKIKEIVTIDVVPHDHKKPEAINYKPALVSNADLYDMMPFKQKAKISFNMRKELPKFLEERYGEFDLCFIDGDHDNNRVIVEDYYFCTKILKEGGIIVFDDYHPTRFSIKSIVDRILEMDPKLNSFMILHSGHIFDHSKAATDRGMVVISYNNLGF
jgi:predicted O-methyltransferase YrrM